MTSESQMRYGSLVRRQGSARRFAELGEERITLDSNSALLTREKDGSLVLAVWNYAPPEKEGAAKTVTLKFKGKAPAQATISVVDPQHGDIHADAGCVASCAPAPEGAGDCIE